MKKTNISKLIASEEYLISTENLPFPLVHYPSFYGTFFGFQKEKKSKIYFCSCSYEAIINYIQLRLIEPFNYKSIPEREFILDAYDYPKIIVDQLLNKNNSDESIINRLNFKNGLCHECNNIVPKYYYCAEMYGSRFKQNFGWYINKKSYEFGISPKYYHYLKDKCSNEILEIIELDPINTIRIYNELLFENPQEAKELRKKLEKQKRKINNIIENEVRINFKHKKIGESWTSETILYHIICSLFPNYTIRRHYRPSFLNGLELDIYIEELNIGIEYQGIQHFKPIKHWGGVDALKKLQQRDIKKKKIMKSLDKPLLYFYYNDDLTNEYILNEISRITKK